MLKRQRKLLRIRWREREKFTIYRYWKQKQRAKPNKEIRVNWVPIIQFLYLPKKTKFLKIMK